MVTCDSFGWNEQTTSSGKLLVSMDPDRKVLARFSPLQINVETFNCLTAMRSALKQSAQKDFEMRAPTRTATTIGTEKYHGWLRHSEFAFSKPSQPRGRD